MQKIFPIYNRESQRDRLQSQLMIIAALAMLTYTIILSLAPIVRLHAVIQTFEFEHWLGLAVWVLSFSFLHQQTTRKLPHRDPLLLPIVAMLTGIGLMTIWRLYPNLGLRQSTWLALATLVVFLGIQFPEYLEYLRRYKYLWLITGLVMTGLTVLLGINPSGTGPALWLKVFGVHFQPSEFLKLLLIVFLAGYFGDKERIKSGFIERMIPTLVVIITAVLLLIFQRDLGTASIFLLVYLTMLISTNKDRIFLWLSPILFIALGLIGYLFTDTIHTRINTWFNPFGDPSGASYQILQSLIAIAEGSLIGSGPGLGSPKLVPVSVSDFIFAAIAEELGFMGILTVITLIILLVYRGLKIATNAHRPFRRILALGLTLYLGLQSMLIIGGNIGLLPLTGVTLPFVSYGGSSLVVTFAALLMLLSISEQTSEVSIKSIPFKKQSALISSLVMGVLVIEILVTSVLSFWYRPYLINRPENPRRIVYDRFVPRGDIVDRANQVIVTNAGLPGAYERVSNHIPLYPVIGYTNPIYGQTGIEASMFNFLRGHTGYSFSTQLRQDLLYNQPLEGLDVRLTLDLNLQRRADSLLADSLRAEEGGAIVLMNAQSGEILSMSSFPYFDAANLASEWATLSEDPSAPLLNRAAQGKYYPGPALLPFMAASDINLLLNFPNPDELIEVSYFNQSCAFPLRDQLNWNALITNGCQETQRELASIMDSPSLLALFEELGFYNGPNMYIEVAEGISPPSEPDPLTAIETMQISPLQAAIAASTLTNQGIRPGPRIVNAYQDPQGNWITLPKFESSERVYRLTRRQQPLNY